jgi:hypothetical protein
MLFKNESSVSLLNQNGRAYTPGDSDENNSISTFRKEKGFLKIEDESIKELTPNIFNWKVEGKMVAIRPNCQIENIMRKTRMLSNEYID